MKTKLFTLWAIVCSIFILISCDNDDNYTPNEAVTSAFKSKYPMAKNLTWETKAGYNVADFHNDSYEAEAWFNEEGQWFMTETDIPFTALPQAVKDSFNISIYKEWKIDDVDKIERSNTGVLYIIEVEQGQNEMDLRYAENGVLISAVADDNNEESYQPFTIPAEVTAFVNEKYPDAVIMEFEREKNHLEIDILDGRKAKEIMLSKDYTWISTEWEIRSNKLPDIIKQSIHASYADYKIDDEADIIDTPTGLFYEVELEKGDAEIKVKFSSDGKEIK